MRFHDRLVALEGRRYRSPFTVHHVAAALAALSEGFALRWAVDPDAVPTDLHGIPRLLDEPPRDLYSVCVYLLFAARDDSSQLEPHVSQ